MQYLKSNFDHDQNNNHPLQPSVMFISEVRGNQVQKLAALAQLFIHNFGSPVDIEVVAGFLVQGFQSLTLPVEIRRIQEVRVEVKFMAKCK